jgi:hypothetical protein
VPSLPLFLYFDPKENLVHFALSTNSADEVIRHGTNALNPQARSPEHEIPLPSRANGRPVF